jgi:hypothetical protein
MGLKGNFGKMLRNLKVILSSRVGLFSGYNKPPLFRTFKTHFPEIGPYFNHFYSNLAISNLILLPLTEIPLSRNRVILLHFILFTRVQRPTILVEQCRTRCQLNVFSHNA